VFCCRRGAIQEQCLTLATAAPRRLYVTQHGWRWDWPRQRIGRHPRYRTAQEPPARTVVCVHPLYPNRAARLSLVTPPGADRVAQGLPSEHRSRCEAGAAAWVGADWVQVWCIANPGSSDEFPHCNDSKPTFKPDIRIGKITRRRPPVILLHVQMHWHYCTTRTFTLISYA